MSDIFISYSSADRDRARLFADALSEHGWSVWWDREIPPGKQFDEVIEQALDSARCVVVLWSQASAASTWVKTEAGEALQRKSLIPAIIEPGVRIPLEFRRLQAADLSDWNGDRSDPRLAQFFKSIEAAAGPPGTPGKVEENVIRPAPAEPKPRPTPPVPPPLPTARKWSPRSIAIIIAGILAVVGVGAYMEREKSREAAEKTAQEQAQRDRAARDEADRLAQERKVNEERQSRTAGVHPSTSSGRTVQSNAKADAPPASGKMNLQWRDSALGYSGSLTWTPTSATLRAVVTDLRTGQQIGNYSVPAVISTVSPAEYAVSGNFAVPGDSTTPGPHTHTARLLVRLQPDGSLRFTQNCPRPGECY